jgi:hypothetical protein
MPIDPDDDISNALNIARQSTGADDIQSKIGGLNQFLSGLDVEANTPQFHTGMNQPQVGGAGMPSNFIPHGDPQRDENLAAFQAGNHPEVPHVVYHGTVSDIKAFDPEKANSEGNAFYFSKDSWTNPNTGARAAGTYAPSRGGNIYPVHLSMKNPYVTGFTKPLPKKDAPDSDWDQYWKDHKKFDDQFNDDNFKTRYFREAMKHARNNGHDGVIIKGVTDDRIHSDLWSEPSDIFAVFHPHQIKSATGNNGQFDPTSPRINEARGGTVEDHAINLVRRHLDHEDYHAA